MNKSVTKAKISRIHFKFMLFEAEKIWNPRVAYIFNFAQEQHPTMENDISLFAQSRRSCSDLVSLGKAAPDPLFDKSLPRASKGEAEGAKLFHRNSGVSIKAGRMFKVVFKMFCIFFISVFSLLFPFIPKSSSPLLLHTPPHPHYALI